jgi:hypothetical protein
MCLGLARGGQTCAVKRRHNQFNIRRVSYAQGWNGCSGVMRPNNRGPTAAFLTPHLKKKKKKKKVRSENNVKKKSVWLMKTGFRQSKAPVNLFLAVSKGANDIVGDPSGGTVARKIKGKIVLRNSSNCVSMGFDRAQQGVEVNEVSL